MRPTLVTPAVPTRRLLLRALLLAGLLTVLLAPSTAAQEPAPGAPGLLTPTEAADHIGEAATVCGTVVSATYASRSRGRPTFLNLDRPYPDRIFTVVIWGENRGAFAEPPERAYRRKHICVTGRIETYRGRPQVEVRGPGQILVPDPAPGDLLWER